MSRLSGRQVGIGISIACAALTVLYAKPIGTPFLNDDYIFLEEARTRPLTGSLGREAILGNYFRPLSREIYFKLLTPLAGGNALVFHLVNYALLLVALALLFDLLRFFLPRAGAMAGTLFFALLPFQRVNLTWVSCSQDLMALAFALASLALFRRGRIAWSLVAYAAALGGKEAALPLPLVLAAWSLWIERRRPIDAARRLWPFALLAAAWSVLIVAFRSDSLAAARLSFDISHFAAGYAHLIQSLLGLDHPPGFFPELLNHGPALIPLGLLAILGWWIGGRDVRSDGGARDRKPPAGAPSTPSDRAPGMRPEDTRRALVFGASWLIAFGIVTGPPSSTWSSYYYTTAAVGGAVLVGLLSRRIDRWGWVVLSAGLLWWHAGSTATRAFAVVLEPWVWTSHLTSFYFDRGAELTAAMRREVAELEPSPPPNTRFFFATLPPWAGFQLGNGPLVRAAYRDTSLGSHFYSRFSDTTAAGKPVRFLYWDGAQFNRLYGNARDPLFQVGGDLLLLGRPGNASYAFRRALGEGGDRMDNLYWLGWAELFRGNRANAEAAWRTFGAKDDSLYWLAHLRAAHRLLLTDHDTLEARRHLIKSIEYGIGRPEGHAVLGPLLMKQRPKYALLELKVASWLKPDDWLARRDLFLGLVRARLDDAAREELPALLRDGPAWRADTTLVTAVGNLERRSGVKVRVAEF